MKAISTGNTYQIYDDSLRTYDRLPAQVYSIRCSKMTGFFLSRHTDIEIGEDKIYGVHTLKVGKVMRSFEAFTRSLGVILSGDKGIGKSLFTKLLAIKAIEHDIPVIIVDQFIPGIASFIESIEQDVMILFDEFDKTFAESSDDKISPQATMLSLFDGLSQGKRLYVITCNELRHLNDYLINRPGRFHYHFRFAYPSADEIREYLQDKLDKEYWGSIDEVTAFASKVNINYDCLRSIAFELNNGESFGKAIKDLNILNTDMAKYNVKLVYDSGLIVTARGQYIDMFDSTGEENTCYLYDSSGYNLVDVTFIPSDAVYNSAVHGYIVNPEDLKLSYCYDKDDALSRELGEKAEASKILYLSITRQLSKNLHYAL